MRQEDLVGRIETVKITRALENNEGFGTFGKIHQGYVKNAALYVGSDVLARFGTFDMKRGSPQAYFLRSKKVTETSLSSDEYFLCGMWESPILMPTLEDVTKQYDPGLCKRTFIFKPDKKGLFVSENGALRTKCTISRYLRDANTVEGASLILATRTCDLDIIKKVIRDNNKIPIELNKIKQRILN
ncbi:MAG TPA: hypothetical protein VKE88_00205 [Candidatus Nanoarchaeia archaeon]|nr:hypothetical protein [Candidatus Nanoarchaeia archaeon]